MGVEQNLQTTECSMECKYDCLFPYLQREMRELSGGIAAVREDISRLRAELSAHIAAHEASMKATPAPDFRELLTWFIKMGVTVLAILVALHYAEITRVL
jgi:hypothetical protein